MEKNPEAQRERDRCVQGRNFSRHDPSTCQDSLESGASESKSTFRPAMSTPPLFAPPPRKASSSLISSPIITPTSQIMQSTLSFPSTSDSAAASSSSLHRRNSRSSNRSGLVPSPHNGSASLIGGRSSPQAESSTLVNDPRQPRFSAPRSLSRQSSTKDSKRPSSLLIRKESSKGKGKQKDDVPMSSDWPKPSEGQEGWRSPMSESSNAEVIETPQLIVERDPGTGRKMINQYLVLEEIGHGSHGRVRLGRDMSVDLPAGEEGDIGLGIMGSAFYAIKIVDRNPKKKRLTGFSGQKGGISRNDGGKLVNESEIRKEIAIFKKVNHPNVVRMKEIIDDPDSSKLYMVLEYCENGEIHWKDEEGSPALSVGEIRRIFRDTLLGLEYLHHQGIIHRDIKPSNLLLAGSGVVKISDFGCSHYSEALRVASAQSGSEGEEYIGDVELAKTAGSPAFFAPEMCYSGLENDFGPRRSLSPPISSVQEIPALTLRPPSVVEDHVETNSSRSDPLVTSPGGRTFPLKPTLSNDSSLSRRPDPARTHSSSTIQQRERLPMTNAIDVWALGVTLYCLLFGKTPFDAPNEYLLMQVIPTADFEIPPFMGKDRMQTGRQGGLRESEEATECLDLLRRLLEKDPGKRISPEQAKRHPFTLRGLSDPTAWLASTDPHAQTFVTVSSDEVAAVVIKSSSFRDKFRKGIKSISHKLQIFGANGRNRSRSIGDVDSATSSAHASNRPSNTNSQLSLQGTPQSTPNKLSSGSRVASGGKDSSPIISPQPPGSLSRRISTLGTRALDVPSSPRPQTIQLASPDLRTELIPTISNFNGQPVNRATNGPANHSGHRGFVVHRNLSSQPVAPGHRAPTLAAPITTNPPHSPRPMASSSSLDKLKNAADMSPAKNLRRRQSSDIDGRGLQRSPSDTSSMGKGFGSKLVRLLSRNSSQRSRLRKKDKGANGSSDVDESVFASAGTSPADAIHRGSLEGLPMPNVAASESGFPSPGFGGLPIGDHLDRPGALTWESRLRNGSSIRRGSSLSEEFTRGVDEEEFDWNETLSDDDDYDDRATKPVLPNSAPNLTPHCRSSSNGILGLEIDPLPIPPPASIAPTLAAIPVSSPLGPVDPAATPASPRPQPTNSAPTSPSLPSEFGHRSPSRATARAAHSPLRANFAADRARSPLGVGEDVKSSTMRLGLSRQTSAPMPEDGEADEGLAISIGSRRGRKVSILGKKSYLED